MRRESCSATTADDTGLIQQQQQLQPQSQNHQQQYQQPLADDDRSAVQSWRALVIKSDLIRLFAGLLTNLNARIQLACLKFYEAIAFECVDAVHAIMTTNYYECALIELIAAYLSRENRFVL